jgi:hypothetical protein
MQRSDLGFVFLSSAPCFMTIHPVSASDSALPPRPHQERPDTTQSAYDSTWTERPDTQAPEGLDRIMGADGKIYVVLAVVLLIWFGLVALLVRTDRKIDRLERQLDNPSSQLQDAPDDAA